MAVRPPAGPSPRKPNQRPGRPRRFDPSTAIDGALELFWKKGFANTTTRDLEAVLSLNQSSIYNAFGSKGRLLDAVLDRYESMASVALLRPLEESDEGIAAIEQFFVKLTDWITHDGRGGCMLINMMAEDGGSSEAITARTSKYRRRVRAALGGALQRSLARGEITVGDLDARASVLFGLVLGLNIAARGCADRNEIKQLAEAVQVQLRSWLVAKS